MLAAAALSTGLLAVVQLKASRTMILAERFVPGAGWVEIAVLAIYAAALVRVMLDPRRQPVWRQRVWLGFSILFFAQLAVGLAGVEQFLMSGELHLPIPAMVLAGPIYREELTFMLIVLGVSLLLVGPAWCSHLCYFGAWDGLAASRKRRPPEKLPGARAMQIGSLVLIPAVAFALNRLGVPPLTAMWLGIGFGVVGVAVMLLGSRRLGVMVHCVTYCPLGGLVTLAGRISPFRMRLAKGCDQCGACATACRYGALATEDIAAGRPSAACTLCGDCVHKCHNGAMRYGLPGLGPDTSRTGFIVMVVSMHAAFVGVAMI